jgi:major type 1 subunit fimbrin (pilin)
MNARVNRARAAAGIATAMTLAMPGRASDGTITFLGAVTGNSCTVQVGAADSNGIVALPVVDTTSLDGSSASRNASAGTFFKITLGNCVANQADVSGAQPAHVAIYFEAGPNVDQTTHALINAGTSNVEVKLYQASETHVVGSPITPGAAGAGQPASQLLAAAATQHFYAGYSLASGAKATAGTVNASVTYSLVYN